MPTLGIKGLGLGLAEQALVKCAVKLGWLGGLEDNANAGHCSLEAIYALYQWELSAASNFHVLFFPTIGSFIYSTQRFCHVIHSNYSSYYLQPTRVPNLTVPSGIWSWFSQELSQLEDGKPLSTLFLASSSGLWGASTSLGIWGQISGFWGTQATHASSKSSQGLT